MSFLLTFLFPFIGFIYILANIIKRKTKNITVSELNDFKFALPLLFAYFGYSLRFGNRENDLTNYFYIIENLKFLNFREVISATKSNLYLQDIFFYFVGYANNNYFLAFIVGLVCYGIVFYIIFDYIKINNINISVDKTIKLIIISSLIISPYTVILNVRAVMAYMMITLAFYKHCKNKKLTFSILFFYLLPLTLHSSSIILLIIVLVSKILKKMYYLSIPIAVFLPKIIEISYNNAHVLGSSFIAQVLKSAISKAYFYINWTSGGWADLVEYSISNKINRYFAIIYLITFSLYILSNINKIKERKESIKKWENLLFFNLFISLVSIGLLSVKTGVYWRFEMVSLVLCPISLLIIDENLDTLFFKFLHNISVIMLILNIVHGLRNISIYDTLISLITSNGFMIVRDILEIILNIFKGAL